MYFNRYNNFFHGIMFHHFHDGKNYRKSDGSIDRDDFYKLIKLTKSSFNTDPCPCK